MESSRREAIDLVLGLTPAQRDAMLVAYILQEREQNQITITEQGPGLRIISHPDVTDVLAFLAVKDVVSSPYICVERGGYMLREVSDAVHSPCEARARGHQFLTAARLTSPID